MKSLILYHVTSEECSRRNWEEVEEAEQGLIYGKSMCFVLNEEVAKNWAKNTGPIGKRHIYKYELPLDGLDVLDIKEHGREMYEAHVSMSIKNECKHDVVIIPSPCIAEEQYESELMQFIWGEGEEESVQRMCDIAKNGEIDHRKQGGELYKLDLSNTEYDVLILNKDTLNKLISI